MKLEDEGDSTGQTPYIFWDGQWTPICGEYFWNNAIGATLICQKLGYVMGAHTDAKSTYTVDSFKVGQCEPYNTLTSCNGGCNDYDVGGYCSNDANKHCNKDGQVKVTIQCSTLPSTPTNTTQQTSSCQGRISC